MIGGRNKLVSELTTDYNLVGIEINYRPRLIYDGKIRSYVIFAAKQGFFLFENT